MNHLRYTEDELLGSMREHRVAHGLLLSPPLRGAAILPNVEVLKLCRRSDGVLSPVLTVEPTAREVTAAIKLARQNREEVKAFKIRLGYTNMSADSPVFDGLYDYAEAEFLPVFFHTGDTAFSNGDLALAHPLSLDRLANKREVLSIVLCHFGNPWFEDAAELLYKHPNVYADTSGLITKESGYAKEYAEWLAKKISEAIYYVGNAEKVLFGTDYPVSTHADALNLIRSLKVEERDKEKILWKNAERVFSL